MVKEAHVELPTTNLILEGDCRLEILGINYVDKAGKQNLGNYNNYFVHWRVLPNQGESLKPFHLNPHRFQLAKPGPGIKKMKSFNSGAEEFVRTFLGDTQDYMKECIKAIMRKRYQGIQETKKITS